MDNEIIDCHVHPFLSEENNTAWFPGTVSLDSFVSELRKAGISKCCGSVIRRITKPTFDQIKTLNREAIAYRNRYPDFFIPGIHVHPSYPDESCHEVEELYHNENVRWVGELVGYILDHPSYLGEGMFKIYDLIQSLGLPVNIHPAAFAEMEVVCNNFPKMNVVIAHPTAKKDDILVRFEFIRKHPNAYLDISGSGLFRWGMLRHGINVAGAHKFIFGTDFPITNPAMQVQGVLAEHLTDAEREAVFSGNFRRLTGLSG
jgi:predicted TIM-barrel fold metal-dependent hydrolase